jgi:hypothetical protein
MPSLFRDRDFRLVAASVALSALGDWVAIVALGLHVKEITDSGFAVAALWVCLFGPSVLVAGHVGLLVDRIEATRLLAVVSVAGAAAAAVLAFSDAVAPVLRSASASAAGLRSIRSDSAASATKAKVAASTSIASSRPPIEKRSPPSSGPMPKPT